jgi:hypothetical protein
MAYFIRRSGEHFSVVQLHPADREEIIASGLALAYGVVFQDENCAREGGCTP